MWELFGLINIKPVVSFLSDSMNKLRKINVLSDRSPFTEIDGRMPCRTYSLIQCSRVNHQKCQNIPPFLDIL